MFPDVKEKVLLLTHENADLDAFASAAIMQRYLKKKKVNATIGVPSHINEQAFKFAFEEKLSFVVNPNLKDYSTIILFDLNDYEQLGKLRKQFTKIPKNKYAVVYAFDHHEIEKRSIVRGAKAFVSPNAISTTEVLYNVLGKNNFDKKMCFYSCIGILEDTGHFLTGSKEGFEVFAKCLNASGKKYSDLLVITKHKVPDNERIAMLKAAKRAKIHKFGETIVATSNLSFFQGQAATKLLEFGADISLVAGTDKHEVTSLSGRVDTTFRDSKNFNLMTHLMKPIQKKLGGEIGGHSGAAQWKGEASPQTAIALAVSILSKRFK